jgi:four helix bundle protein
MNKKRKLTSFTQLDTWKEAHKLVLLIYELTNKFPEKERYVLVSQMLRAAISITSNIAEGFTRKGKKEKKQFYYVAKASLTELQNQLLIAKDINYIDEKEFNKTSKQLIVVVKLLSGLIKGVNKLS